MLCKMRRTLMRVSRKRWTMMRWSMLRLTMMRQLLMLAPILGQVFFPTIALARLFAAVPLLGVASALDLILFD